MSHDVELQGAPDGLGLRVGSAPAAAALARFSRSAARDDRRLVVGGLITDGAGRLFVQRRSAERALFPGAWDVVGGHAEEGEDAGTALRREVGEETGWKVLEIGPVVELIDWEAGGVRRREVDVLVTVAGDLAAPALEEGKHDAWLWLATADAELLGAGRDPSDAWLRTVVARGLAMLAASGFGAR